MGKVFLIDDHSLVRGGFSRLVCQLPGFEVVGEASSIEEALPLLRECQVDIITLDLALPGLSGRNGVTLLQESVPQARILVISARLDPAEVQSLLELGVLGYLSKESPATEFLEALRSVKTNQTYLSRAAAGALATAVRTRTQSPTNPLSGRLLEVLQMISDGLTTREIASKLYLSPRTVEKYRGQILRKLDCRNQIEALGRAKELGLLN